MFNNKMSKMIKQAQEMQKKMTDAQSKLGDVIVESESGGGMVKVSMNANMEIIDLKIEDSVLKEDKEMIEDLIISALSAVISKAQDASKSTLNDATGGMLQGMKIPGM